MIILEEIRLIGKLLQFFSLVIACFYNYFISEDGKIGIQLS